MNGIINIYKKAGMTSFDVVYKIRKLTGIKKVGHTGTLDPDAEGVLPVCIGKATKVADILTFSDKRYTAWLKLGITTDTQDASGTVLSVKQADFTPEQITQAINKFIGEIEQIPPMYSAIKIGGKKLYELARKGIDVERKPRKIKIYEINILSIEGDVASLDVSCSKGTYIRTLCNDIGEELGCGAHMQKLIRTASSVFTLDKAVCLECLTRENIGDYLIATDEMFDYPKIKVSGEDLRKVLNGNKITLNGICENQKYRVYDDDGNFLCISEGKDEMLSLVKSFYG